MKKQPEVTEKTRQKLLDAFWELMEKRQPALISVRDVTDLAGYNRTTFYEYFTGIDPMLCQMEDQLLAEIDGSEALVPGLSAAFCASPVRFSLLLGPTGDPAFPHKLAARLLSFAKDGSESARVAQVWGMIGLLSQAAKEKVYAKDKVAQLLAQGTALPHKSQPVKSLSLSRILD